MAEPLLPCPFCDAELLQVGSDYQHPDNDCIEASLSFPPTPENVAAWNKRAPNAPALPSQPEPLEPVTRRALEALAFHAISGPVDGAFTRDDAKNLIDYFATRTVPAQPEGEVGEAQRLYEYVGKLGVHGPDPKPWAERSSEHQALWIGAIAALRAQPKGEAVAWRYRVKIDGVWRGWDATTAFDPTTKPRPSFWQDCEVQPLYAHPAPAEGDKLREAFMAAIDFTLDNENGSLEFLRAWREGDTEEWPEFNTLKGGAA